MPSSARRRGESTLLLHLAGLLPERQRCLHRHGSGGGADCHDVQGLVRVDDVALSPETVRTVRARVGIVFADPDDQIVGLAAGEDVDFGPRARRFPPEDAAAAAREALEECASRAARAASRTTSARARSAGCASRARPPAAPGPLLLDEPSSGLDPRGRELGELLSRLTATLVVASHDLAVVERLCSRAVVLDGSVVADRKVADVLADAALLARHGLA